MVYNQKLKIFNLCYETCKTCKNVGDPENHNCETCDVEHQFVPAKNSPNNCFTQCKYYYYITYFGNYKCTNYPQCPEEAQIFIKDKNKCIDSCLKDDDYKYQHKGNCLKNCPEGTIVGDDGICVNPENICQIKENVLEVQDINDNQIIQNKIMDYIREFEGTDIISTYTNNDYTLIIFKNSSCVSELDIKISGIYFGECYNKVKENYNFDDELIIAILENYKTNRNNPYISFGLFNPKSGEKIEIKNICTDSDNTVVLNKDILSSLDGNNTNYDVMIELLDQNINIFNISDDFFTDLCFYFRSPTKKDIPVKDRLTEFYPNISLCDSECKMTGINYTTKNAICDCPFNDILNNNIINTEGLDDTVGNVKQIINNSNIEVLKCLLKALRKINQSTGAIIIIILGGCTTIFVALFYIFQFPQMKIYIFEFTNDFISLLNDKIKVIRHAPPKKIKKIEKQENSDISEKNSKRRKPKKSFRNNNFVEKGNSIIYSSKSNDKFYKGNNAAKFYTEFGENDNINNLSGGGGDENTKINFFREYLSKPVEKMSFDYAYKYDKRSFCELYYYTITNKVMTLNTFLNKDPFKPIILKIITYISTIVLYFIINGFFFSTDYISKVYHLKTEEKFFSFVPRSLNRMIYTVLISFPMVTIIDCFFVDEARLKRIFIREQNNIPELRDQIIQIKNLIQRRLLAFFIFIFIVFIIGFFYVVSFNYVYYFTQIEWIKSTLFIFIFIEFLVIFLCLVSNILRLISLKCKSERLFKLSNLVNIA